MEVLETIRPWVVPIIAIVSFGIAFVPKFNTRFRVWVTGPLETKVDLLSEKVDNLSEQMKEMRSDMKNEHAMLLKAFTDHLIHQHGHKPE